MSYEASHDGNRLSIVGQGLHEIPSDLARKYGTEIEVLDLTGNAIRYDASRVHFRERWMCF